MNILKQVQEDEAETIGYWGLITATQDWCEDNYTYTHYIAEFWNTLSNIFILFFGIFGFISAYRAGCEKRFLLSYTGLFIVGIGSFIFHCTLQWKAQLLDEVPMIICSMPLLFSLFASDMVSKTKIKILSIVLTIYPMVVIPYYVITRDYLVFIIAYGSTVLGMIFQSYFIIKRINKVIPQKEQIYPNNPKKLIFKSMFFYGMAFVLWNIDNELCSDLKEYKQMLPQNIQPLLELHAWWHFGSGYGTYLCILFSQVCFSLNKRYVKEVQQLNKNSANYASKFYYKNYLPYICSIKDSKTQQKQT